MALILGTKIAQHDACFSLVRDGEVLCVYEEERFNRVKHGHCSTSIAFNAILQDYGLKISDIDYVTNYIDTQLFPFILNDILDPSFREAKIKADPLAQSSMMDWFYNAYAGMLLAYGFEKNKIVPVRHHLAHMAGAFYPSHCINAAIISADGFGESESAVIAHGVGQDINILATNKYPASLGALYLAFTNFLGWDYGEEGKTMALASYGKPKYLDKFVSEYLNLDEIGFFTYSKPEKLGECTFLVNPFVDEMFGTPRARNEKLTQYHMDIAATIQELTNQTFIKLAKEAKRLTNEKSLVISGGVALNSVANGQILKQKIFDEVFVFPHSNDAGTAIGGALWVEYAKLGKQRKHYWTFENAYLGKRIDIENTASIAQKYGISWKKIENPPKTAAREIAAGKIVGWIQGNAEIGPRALGNRSILGNPAIPEIKDIINARVKNRESWRPFAPSVLAEDTSIYFDTQQKLPYMIIVADVRPEWRDKLPSVTHVDGTARVQSVERHVNPLFYDLLKELKNITGLGMALNTSFNAGGEPIIATVEQAIRNFLTTQMDVLIIGDYLFDEKSTGRQCEKFAPKDCILEALDPARPVYLMGITDNSPISAFETLITSLKTWPMPVAVSQHLDQGIINRCRVIDYNTLPNEPDFANATIILLGGQTASHWTFDAYLMRAELVAYCFNNQHPNFKIISVAMDGGVSDLRVLQKHQRVMLENGSF